MHDPGSPGIGFVPSQADRSAPVSGAGQLPRYLRGGYRDATPLLTGAPRPSTGPRHSAEPAPQRRTLAARYRSADPIDLDGATVYPMYSEQLPTPASALTMTLLSATPPAGLAAVGIGLSVIDGYIDLDDRHLAGVDIWRDALERGITFDLAADSPDALFALTPVWSNAAGEPQSWSGNYGIVVERTETGRTVLWCSMGEGPPHFADLVIEVRSTPLDPHPHLFMSGAIPTVSTATPPERPSNRHHWMESDDPDSDDPEFDPWAAHYEPAADDSAPSADESPIEPTAVEALAISAVDDSPAAPLTDDPATGSTTPESGPAPVVHEPEWKPTAADSEPEPTTSAPTLSAPAVSTPAVSTPSAADPPAPPTVWAHITIDPLPTPTPSAHTTIGSLPALTAAAHTTIGALSEITSSAHTTTDPLPTPTTSAHTTIGAVPPLTAPEHTTVGAPAVSVPATTNPAAAPTVSTPTTGDLASAPQALAPLTATTTRNSPPAPRIHNSLTAPADSDHSGTPAVESAAIARHSPAAHSAAKRLTTPPAPDSPTESPVGKTVWTSGAADSVTESAEDDAEIQGYPCSFADIQLSAPAYADEPDHTADLEATAPHRALADDFTGYDDPLTGTEAGRRYSDDADSPPDTGRYGWAENPELTGLVPVIRDAGFTDYGPEPSRPAATDSIASTSPYCTPLLSGDDMGTEYAVRDDHSMVDTLADGSLAPVPPVDLPYTDDEIDPARLHSLGAVAHAQGDDDRAHLLWTRAARAGHLGATYDLGALSLHRNDPRAAERWWRAAAGRRMIPAMAELAVLLEQRGAVAEAHMWRTQAVAEEVIATATRRPAAGEILTGMH
ncbi:hypothetical protein [Nocardia carnea]|uniref:Tetratricopeptide repeat protein n=1 Tax=Nocardia carnea TaxID=37328 RepID=A0ABW7TGR0_9NOCA|nr:hypothetical protein [Nocardia carnea]